MAGGIKITPRNLSFIITDKNKTKFSDNKTDETLKWIKSTLIFYYFNSFINPHINDTKNKNELYTKKNFEEDIYKDFKECEKDKEFNIFKESFEKKNISEEKKYPDILKDLIDIQESSISKKEITDFHFEFGNFVKNCLELEIEEDNLKYIIAQIKDTLYLLHNSILKEEFLYSFYQIKIIERLYNQLLENIGAVKVENKGKKLNSDDLLTINALKPILLKFRLLEFLTLKNTKNFGYNMTTIFYRNDIGQLMDQLDNLIIYKNKNALKNFISFCNKYHYFIVYIETIFPYNKFNKNCTETDFKIAIFYIELLTYLYKNKINFYFIFDDVEIKFIFNDKQYKIIKPILKLNEENNIYLSIDTGVKYKNQNYKLINIEDNVGEKYTIYTINWLKKNINEKLESTKFKNIFEDIDKEKVDSISKEKFLTSKLFLTSNSIIPKMWTLLFSFDKNSKSLKYIIDNLLDIEKEIYDIIKNTFDNLNDLLGVENCFDFTKKMAFFYEETSFLWRDLIGKEIEKNLSNNELNNYKNKIDDEKYKLETLKIIHWPDDKINNYRKILDDQYYAIDDMIEREEKYEKIRQQEKYLRNLKDKVDDLKIKNNKSLEIYKGKIGKKIHALIEELKDLEDEEIEKKKKKIEREYEDLKGILNEKINSLYGNDINWQGESLINNDEDNIDEEDSKESELYWIMLDYVTSRELVKKRLNATDNREKMKYGTEIEKLELISVLNFISSIESEDSALGEEDNKIIESLLRAQLMLKLCEICYLVKDFFKVLKDRSKRNEISEKEYVFSYKICHNYSLTTQIIQPKFEPNDIIYLFFVFSEKDDDNKDRMSIGPIFSDKVRYNKNLKSIYRDALSKIRKLNKPDILEICKICSIKIYLEITKEYTKNINENLTEDELNKKNFEELISYFETDWKNEEDPKNRSMKEEISKSIKSVMDLAKNFDIIIKEEENQNNIEEKNNFDDMEIFKKEKNKRLNAEELITKKINPSFKYYIIKNIKVVEELINTGLKENDIAILFKADKETNYIPFWVFLIRNMSSLNCIYYENKKNNNLDIYKKITTEIRKKIGELIKDINKIIGLI